MFSRTLIPFWLVIGLASAAPICRAQTPSAGWVDPSPHRVRFVTVDRVVQLEVLDWGGRGPALVFLAGLGNTAHIFDDFAPRFRDAFRVYAITRRGVGYSSDPADGYDPESRARDIVTVLEALHIQRAVLAGHSIAGEEISNVAATYPNRVGALVYIEAYDYGPEMQAALRAAQPPASLIPRMTAADSSSPASVTAFWSRVVAGASAPEAEIRAQALFASDGKLIGPRAHNGGKAGAAAGPSPFDGIEAPALGLFATSPGGASELFQNLNYASLDRAGREDANRFFDAVETRRKAGRDRFRNGMPDATVIELPGAGHFVFLSQPDRVEREMRSFLATIR